jgi:hypothetical protein
VAKRHRSVALASAKQAKTLGRSQRPGTDPVLVGILDLMAKRRPFALKSGRPFLSNLPPRRRWPPQPRLGSCCRAAWAPWAPWAGRQWWCADATWRPSWGSARSGPRGRGSPLATLGARLELAALCGRCRVKCLPKGVLLITGQRTTTLRDYTPRLVDRSSSDPIGQRPTRRLRTEARPRRQDWLTRD